MRTPIPKDKLEAIRAAMNAALANIAKAHGLQSLKIAPRMTYDQAGAFHAKVEGVVSGGLTKEEQNLDAWRRFAKEIPARGNQFKTDGDVYEVYGANQRLTKVLCRNVADGKVYLFSPRFLTSLVEKGVS